MMPCVDIMSLDLNTGLSRLLGRVWGQARSLTRDPSTDTVYALLGDLGYGLPPALVVNTTGPSKGSTCRGVNLFGKYELVEDERSTYKLQNENLFLNFSQSSTIFKSYTYWKIDGKNEHTKGCIYNENGANDKVPAKGWQYADKNGIWNQDPKLSFLPCQRSPSEVFGSYTNFYWINDSPGCGSGPSWPALQQLNTTSLHSLLFIPNHNILVAAAPGKLLLLGPGEDHVVSTLFLHPHSYPNW